MILGLRTDNPTAEVLLIGDKGQQLADYSWLADRELSTTLHSKIHEQLNSLRADWKDLTGIIFYEGPGSFTGLRIGATLVNTLATELSIPAVQSSGQDWLKAGLGKLAEADSSNNMVTPNYGRPARITKPRK